MEINEQTSIRFFGSIPSLLLLLELRLSDSDSLSIDLERGVRLKLLS